MNNTTTEIPFVEAHISTAPGMFFYTSLDAIQRDENLLGYYSVVSRAWHELQLDGILVQDGRPILYLKEYGRPFSSQERVQFQRLFWNQGVANVLILADPANVYIYSGLAKPEKDPEDEEVAALVEILSKADYVRQIQAFYHALATGRYYETNQKKFDPDQTVDKLLLDNLSAFRNKLIDNDKKLDTNQAHAFIGRVLFLCYLFDRGIVSVGKKDRAWKDNKTGTTLLVNQLEELSFKDQLDYLYNLFHDLKKRFNGNMFDQDLHKEKRLIRSAHMKHLILFLGGHDVKSGQMSLGFWPYNFKMIPVETISAIYQDFLSVENREKQRKTGAFYTPRFLAEMVVDTAVHDDPDVLDSSFLDPACGSGIFLVILFNRLANRWMRNQTKRVRYTTKAKALQEILARQIRGIDLSETACRIASFSLYLAFLDYFNPPDIQEYVERTGKPLPRLIDYGDKNNSPKADIPIIYKADFLNEKILSDQSFGCIIGNPPWEGRGRKQLAQKFMEKTPRFLRENGIGCLLLPTKILQNQTDTFQSEWLITVTLEKVIQLADYRRLLFQNAKTPAFIARFRNTPPEAKHHLVEFSAPKFHRDGLRQGVIPVNPYDRSWIPLADVLSAAQARTAPVIWKRRLWGTRRDQKLLDFLQSLPPLSDLAGSPKEGKRWIKGQGFQPYYPEKAKNNPKYPNPKPNPWKIDSHFVPADQYLPISLLKTDFITLDGALKRIEASKKFMRRAPNSNLFRTPMVLISRGFGNVAYSNHDVLFQHYLQSISGPYEDADLLLFLTVYLRSKLAKYFLFHTSANWGTERDYVNFVELLRVPFPLSGHEFISSDAEEIVRDIVRRVDDLCAELGKAYDKLKTDAEKCSMFDKDKTDFTKQWNQDRKKRVEALQEEFEPLIYQYFGLTEQDISLIEDTIHVFEPSSTPTTWRSPKILTLDQTEKANALPYDRQGLSVYANTLTKTLNGWAKAEGSEYRIGAVGGIDEQTGLAMVTLSISDTELDFKPKSISRHLFNTLKKYHDHMATDQGTLIYSRDILFSHGKKIHIVRPDILINWTRTSALNDAARIYGEIALGKEEV